MGNFERSCPCDGEEWLEGEDEEGRGVSKGEMQFWKRLAADD